jgi:hypothetical protein
MLRKAIRKGGPQIVTCLKLLSPELLRSERSCNIICFYIYFQQAFNQVVCYLTYLRQGLNQFKIVNQDISQVPFVNNLN